MPVSDDSREPCGVLIIDKEPGMTSHDIVNRVRRLYGTRRVGHAGTLDPMARGVLVVLVGRAAKAAEYITVERKSYSAVLRLGITTDTGDITGKILTVSEAIPVPEKVKSAAAAFIGEQKQIPPMYSALKVNGRKLVDLARKGIEIEREPRDITIYSLSCAETDIPSDYTLEVLCSKGTYIRTLCEDIGSALGCGGTMAALTRLSSGGFSLDGAAKLGEIEEMSVSEREGKLLPVESLFEDEPILRLEGFFEKLACSGAEIYQSKIGTSYETGRRLRLYGEDGFFALGEVRNFEQGSAVKPVKFFVL